ncbi:hypothetical protein DL769_008674 [Monosporascus sp. CRB-8-3]|nr:hypothetical protein DL769_008674 [Monosporascus sp. CRB-8-3]
MSLVNIEPESFSNLEDKVIVVIGATTGIGAAVIRQLTDIRAKVVWGDVAEPPTPDARFVRTDATSYGSVLDLFKTALAAHGRIDHAVYSAGLAGPGEDGRLLDTVTAFPSSPIEEEPSTRVLDVNLRGAIFFTRIAAHYLRESLAAANGEGSARGREGEAHDDDASILLVGSSTAIAGFAGPVQYGASKHGVLGLFRGARSILSANGSGVGIRMNVVVPSLTRTQMISKFVDIFASRGLMCNEPEDVASAITHALASRADGEGYYVAGSKTYEIEKRLEALRAQWLGEDVYRDLVAVQDAFADIARHKPQV